MRFSARVLNLLLLFVIAICYCLFALPRPALAQTPAPTFAQTSKSYAAPNMDPEVPRNQHTFAQATTIEVLAAIHCILTGIDPIDPLAGCVGINPDTRRLGISKPPLDEYGRPEVTGMLGFTVGLVASTYQPIASTGTYVQYISDRFGIVTKAHAAPSDCVRKSGYGFCGLQPILKLWETTRNLSYALLTLAAVFIGVGIMLRIKIDPRTVMTIQNQIPKVIISVILITLSYAMSALLIDLMWISTYTGTYLLVQKHDPVVSKCTAGVNGQKLSEKATTTILQTPITYFNNIFSKCDANETAIGMVANDKDGGFHVMTKQVADNFGNVIGNVARSILFDSDDLNEPGCQWWHPIKCAKKAAVNFIGVVISAVAKLIIFVILVIAMFKIWFNLLKAFVYTLVYIILGPIMIVFGLLPTKPMGFESWLRRLFVNVAVFPITVFLFVGARLLMELYNNQATDQFVPPLVGNPTDTNFGALMAFGVLLIAPTIQTILREKMGVKNIGTPGIVGAGIAAGAAVVGAPVGRAMKHLTRSDHRTQDYGLLARAKQQVGRTALKIPAGLGSVSAKKQLIRNELLTTHGQLGATGRNLKRGKNETKDEHILRLDNLNPGGNSGATGAAGAGTGTPRRRWFRGGRPTPPPPAGSGGTPPTPPPTGGGIGGGRPRRNPNRRRTS